MNACYFTVQVVSSLLADTCQNGFHPSVIRWLVQIILYVRLQLTIKLNGKPVEHILDWNGNNLHRLYEKVVQ